MSLLVQFNVSDPSRDRMRFSGISLNILLNICVYIDAILKRISVRLFPKKNLLNI